MNPPEHRFEALPWHRNLGFRVAEAGPEGVILTGTPPPEAEQAFGTVHGGWLTSLLDGAAAAAVHEALPAGTAFTSIELSMRFLRPAAPGQPLRARARVVRAGRTTATTEAVCLLEDGREAALYQGTFLIRRESDSGA